MALLTPQHEMRPFGQIGWMIVTEEWVLIRRLVADGIHPRQVGRDLGIDRGTVARASLSVGCLAMGILGAEAF